MRKKEYTLCAKKSIPYAQKRVYPMRKKEYTLCAKKSRHYIKEDNKLYNNSHIKTVFEI